MHRPLKFVASSSFPAGASGLYASTLETRANNTVLFCLKYTILLRQVQSFLKKCVGGVVWGAGRLVYRELELLVVPIEGL